MLYANTDLQDHMTLSQYSIPNDGIIQLILRVKAGDGSEIQLAELPPSQSPPPPEAIVVVEQPMAYVTLEKEPNENEPQAHEETEPQEDHEEPQEQVEENYEIEEPVAKKKRV